MQCLVISCFAKNIKIKNQLRQFLLTQPVSLRSQAESNRCTRFCRPLPNRSAMEPSLRDLHGKVKQKFPSEQIFLANFEKIGSFVAFFARCE